MTWEELYWEILERFKWTCDQLDALPLDKLHEYLQVREGRIKAG